MISVFMKFLTKLSLRWHCVSVTPWLPAVAVTVVNLDVCLSLRKWLRCFAEEQVPVPVDPVFVTEVP